MNNNNIHKVPMGINPKAVSMRNRESLKRTAHASHFIYRQWYLPCSLTRRQKTNSPRIT